MADFTVTVEGPERHDGESPYTYVVSATDGKAAGAFVLAMFRKEQDTDDCNLLEVAPGVPHNV